MKTYTPALDPAALHRLREFATLFAPDFPHAKPARWAGVYLHGLLADGDRKSVEPLARRVALPAGLTSADPEQALQQFVSQSPWDHAAVLRRYRGHLAATFADPQAVFVIDDTTFPKQGRHSVGVQRQYCGAVGKKANCQAAVSVHYVAPRGHYPLALRLFLPESWAADADRLDRAGVPAEHRRERTKGQVALDLLDRVRAEGLPGRVVLADADYILDTFPIMKAKDEERWGRYKTKRMILDCYRRMAAGDFVSELEVPPGVRVPTDLFGDPVRRGRSNARPGGNPATAFPPRTPPPNSSGNRPRSISGPTIFRSASSATNCSRRKFPSTASAVGPACRTCGPPSPGHTGRRRT